MTRPLRMATHGPRGLELPRAALLPDDQAGAESRQPSPRLHPGVAPPSIASPKQGRHHADPSILQQVVKTAASRAGIAKHATCHTLRIPSRRISWKKDVTCLRLPARCARCNVCLPPWHRQAGAA